MVNKKYSFAKYILRLDYPLIHWQYVLEALIDSFVKFIINTEQSPNYVCLNVHESQKFVLLPFGFVCKLDNEILGILKEIVVDI